MDSNIFSLVKTKSDIDKIVGEIDILIDSLYRTGEADFDHAINNKIRQDSAKFLAEHKQDLEALKIVLQGSKIIKLTLAFEATNLVAEKILTWLRKNIDPDLVLDLAYDSKIIAGAIIEYQGKYADMSISKKLEALGL